ncbi:MAG: sterol desaturase family protein [Gammaproteobacteria bacterium]|nr:sterol desaturase family protein [Gammaproteobacteria bacterium]
MIDWLVTHEAQVRSGFFCSLLILFMLLEAKFPKRVRRHSRKSRWTANIGLVFVNSITIRLVMPLATIGVAQYAQAQGFGLFNMWQVHPLMVFVVSIIVFDCAIYWQHRLFHAIPILWKLHRVHHVDQDIDVTTGSRFHPIEICLSLLIKFALVLLIGPSMIAVMVFEIILNGMAMFNHANLFLSNRWDQRIRRLLVTPDMHRVHHSTIRSESDRNFGFNLSCWDRWFGSYQSQPSLGHDDMHIGVADFTDPKQTQRLGPMLWLPFSKPAHK